MKNIILLIICGFNLCGLSFVVQAEALQKEISSFSDLPTFVKKIGNPAATLIVMDDDDTLTKMKCDISKSIKSCQYLGGPAWYSWQSVLLQNHLKEISHSPYRVADTQDQLINIASLLLAINNMDYAEKAIPTVLGKMTDKGVRLMVETARGNNDVSATQSQFSKLKVGSSLFSNFIESNALRFGQAQIPSLASPFPGCKGTNDAKFRDDITYQQGVVYVSGQNKGKLLKCILNEYNKDVANSGLGIPIKHIIFMDDTLANVVDVHKAFKNEEKYHVYALHYTALREHKSALTQGKHKVKLQKNANARWVAIKSALETNLLEPNLPKSKNKNKNKKKKKSERQQQKDLEKRSGLH